MRTLSGRRPLQRTPIPPGLAARVTRPGLASAAGRQGQSS